MPRHAVCHAEIDGCRHPVAGREGRPYSLFFKRIYEKWCARGDSNHGLWLRRVIRPSHPTPTQTTPADSIGFFEGVRQLVPTLNRARVSHLCHTEIDRRHVGRQGSRWEVTMFGNIRRSMQEPGPYLSPGGPALSVPNRVSLKCRLPCSHLASRRSRPRRHGPRTV
jgi:hypothetical protein